MTPSSPSRFYSLAAARRGLVHFLVGKLAAGLLGIGFLLLSIRAMEPVAYGRYVAVMAGAEVFYLISGMGLSTIAQRYVAEYRLRAVSAEFAQFLRRHFLRRVVYSVVGAGAVLVAWGPLMALTGLALPRETGWVVAGLLVGSAGVFFLEEVMGACLLQGYSQGLAFARNLIRVAAVVIWWQWLDGLTLERLLWIEALVCVASWLVAEGLVRRWADRAPSAPGAVAGYSAGAMAPVARRFYLVQLMGQAYGTNIVKMVVFRLLGASQAASFGVAQSVADMIRNYLPAHLLAGWVRPLMVARYVQNRDLDEICRIASLVLKLNLLGLLPFVAVFAVVGDDLMAWVTAGRYPALGTLLAWMIVGLVMHTTHLLMSMLTLTLEAPAANLRATAMACLTLPAVILLIRQFGVVGAATAVVLTEVVWIGTAWTLLRLRGFRLWFEWRGALNIALATTVGAVLAWLASRTVHHTAVSLLALGAGYLVTLAVLRPASAQEVDMLRRLLQSRKKSN